ncbi:hypothetical protein DSM112329_00318 [Paraconexibacter sp. AEG42_29]|uniref:Uncharacterized protein n=1 Tax=Paraconexibacter sp. AEG42_29 TaxID=2997339 RepID=A0AAU7APD3_9ACTN
MTEPELTPPEQRLHDLLADVRDREPDPGGPGLEDQIMRTARWQYVARGTLRAVGDLSAVVAMGLRLLVGPDGEPRREPRS